jgi:hypothetical protein
MAEKKSFALRIDAETMKAIEKWAADEFRSVNGQIEWMMYKSLKEAGRLKNKPDKNKNDKTEKNKSDKKEE